MSISKLFVSLFAVMAMSLVGCSQQPSAPKEDVKAASAELIKHLDANSFTPGIEKGIVMVDFWATWCPPCRQMAPILDEVAKDVSGKVTVAKVDVDQNREIASRYNIQGIPTLILFKDGKEINRFVGLQSKDYLIQQLNLVK
ncbi:thioredoxin [Williamwhitmania taraxaci]|uniref:Thioredoxin n=1 Tax=Williamwhitmania taraxaci TaxID=1640674 RepID=A0A1G6GUB7_9BACT|nr:thioredoxin [Williamwhitmania taraxaci]SDB85503.1 thioredoxin [Williamwhitmania taraxaci]